MQILFNRLQVVFLFLVLLEYGCGSDRKPEHENSKIEKEESPVEQPANKPGKVDVNIFMHDSKSMNGFRFVGSQLGDEVLTFFTRLGDPQNHLVASTKSHLLNTDDEVKISPLGSGINGLADHIKMANKTDGKHGPILKTTDKDYSKMLEAIISKTMGKSNEVSAFVSDLVYYPGDAEGKDIKAYLKTQSSLIQNTFQTTLAKQPELCLILLRGVSNYKWDGKVTSDRPFYVLFVGKKKNLQPIMGFAQKKWPGKYFWFELIEKTKTPNVVVAPGHNWAKGTYKADHHDGSLIKEPNQRGNQPGFSFVSEVDLKEFYGLEYLVMDSTKYIGGQWKVERIGKHSQYSSNMEGAYQFEISSTVKPTRSEFVISLPYTLPGWITQSSHVKYPSGSISEPEYSGKTFGFEPLMKGIIEAYHIGEKDLIQLKFKIEQ